MNRIARSIAEGRRPPLWIGFIYLLVGATWIGVTALVLGRLVSDPRRAALLQTGKRWLYVLLSAAIVYLLAKVAQRAITQDRERIHVYRIVQEAVTNGLKHVRPERVRVTVTAEERELRIQIRDDGHGFDPRTSAPGARGLWNMRARAEAAEGRLDVESEPGKGTLVSLRVPHATASVGP